MMARIVASCVLVGILSVADLALAQGCPCDFAAAASKIRGAREACWGVWSSDSSGDTWDGVAGLDYYKIKTTKIKGQPGPETPGERPLEMWLNISSGTPYCNITFFRKSGAVSSAFSAFMVDSATISACIGDLENLVSGASWPLYDDYQTPATVWATDSCNAGATSAGLPPAPGVLQDFFPPGDETELGKAVGSASLAAAKIRQ